jgi:hypothetical protein
MYPSAYDREREMPPSLMNLQTDNVRRHFTVAWCKCHNHQQIYRQIKSVGISQSGGNATLTDKFTEGYRPSASNQELKNIYWICHYHRRNKSVGIFQARIFFCSQFPYVKPSVIFFFVIDRLSDGIRYYRRMVCHENFLSVI